MRLAIATDVPAPYRDALYESMAQRLGHDFHVFYWSAHHPRRRWSLSDSAYDYTVLSDRVLAFGERSLHLVPGAWKAVAHWGPDTVIIAGWEQPASWAIRRWCARVEIPSVAWIESHASSGTQRGPLSNALRRRFLTRFSAAVVPSDESSEFLLSLGFRKSTLIFPNTVVPPKPVAPTTTKAGVTLLFVGSLTPRKNPALVLDIGLFGKSTGEHVHTIFAGEGSAADGLVDRSQAEGISTSLMGYVGGAKLEALWAEADCLILPSLADPAPLVLSEAAARGVPFVASTNCGGAETLISRGATGSVLSLSESPSAWWQASMQMINRGHPIDDVLPSVAATRLIEFMERRLEQHAPQFEGGGQ